jgi:uncharacterized protein
MKSISVTLPEKAVHVEVKPEKTLDHEPYIETASGIKFHFLDPRQDEIDILDIAHSLSNQCRFTGHTSEFYSVAEHSILVSKLTGGDNRMRLCGLLHDACEAYMTDVATPVKAFLTNYRPLEYTMWKAVAHKFGLPVELPDEVKKADRLALLIEAKQLIASGGSDWIEAQGVEVPDTALDCNIPKIARYYFMKEFAQLTGLPEYCETLKTQRINYASAA